MNRFRFVKFTKIFSLENNSLYGISFPAIIVYRIAGMLAAGKFGKFGESSVIRQTLTSQILVIVIVPYGQNLSIRQTLFCQLLLIR